MEVFPPEDTPAGEGSSVSQLEQMKAWDDSFTQLEKVLQAACETKEVRPDANSVKQPPPSPPSDRPDSKRKLDDNDNSDSDDSRPKSKRTNLLICSEVTNLVGSTVNSCNISGTISDLLSNAVDVGQMGSCKLDVPLINNSDENVAADELNLIADEKLEKICIKSIENRTLVENKENMTFDNSKNCSTVADEKEIVSSLDCKNDTDFVKSPESPKLFEIKREATVECKTHTMLDSSIKDEIFADKEIVEGKTKENGLFDDKFFEPSLDEDLKHPVDSKATVSKTIKEQNLDEQFSDKEDSLCDKKAKSKIEKDRKEESVDKNFKKDDKLLKKKKFERCNIRDIKLEDELDAVTLSAQKEEQERIRRLQEAQMRALQERLQIIEVEKEALTQLFSQPPPDAPNLFDSASDCTSEINDMSEEKDKIPLIKSESDVILLESSDEDKKAKLQEIIPSPIEAEENVIDISSSSSDSGSDTENELDTKDDDIMVLSDGEAGPEAGAEDPNNSGAHTNDCFNLLDHEGRVLVNVGHPPEDPDIFLAPQIAKVIKPHQIGGIRFLYDNVVENLARYKSSSGFGCILAHSMGLGKTVQVVSFVDVFLRHTPATLVLCIVPINTIQNWKAEFDMWVPSSTSVDDEQVSNGEVRPRDYNVYTLNENFKTMAARSALIAEWRNDGGVLLMGYEMYRMLALRKLPKAPVKKARRQKKQDIPIEPETNEQIKKFMDQMYDHIVIPGPDLVICDEGHRIKNSLASTSMALKSIKTRRRVVLTGYPLQNNLLEYWCMVDFVRPNYLGSRAEFCNMFERPISNGQCIDSTPRDRQLMRFRSHVLHSLLVGFVQRRGHSVLRAVLPKKEEHVLLIRMTPIQRKLYKCFVKDLLYVQQATNPLKLFAVCCKIWNHPDILYKLLQEKKAQEDIDLDIDLSTSTSSTTIPGANIAIKRKAVHKDQLTKSKTVQRPLKINTQSSDIDQSSEIHVQTSKILSLHMPANQIQGQQLSIKKETHCSDEILPDQQNCDQLQEQRQYPEMSQMCKSEFSSPLHSSMSVPQQGQIQKQPQNQSEYPHKVLHSEYPEHQPSQQLFPPPQFSQPSTSFCQQTFSQSAPQPQYQSSSQKCSSQHVQPASVHQSQQQYLSQSPQQASQLPYPQPQLSQQFSHQSQKQYSQIGNSQQFSQPTTELTQTLIPQQPVAQHHKQFPMQPSSQQEQSFSSQAQQNYLQQTSVQFPAQSNSEYPQPPNAQQQQFSQQSTLSQQFSQQSVQHQQFSQTTTQQPLKSQAQQFSQQPNSHQQQYSQQQYPQQPTQQQKYPQQPSTQQYPQSTAQQRQYTTQLSQQFSKHSHSQHHPYPEQPPSSQHQQYSKQPALQQQYPEQPPSQHEQYPDQPPSQHQYPEQSAVQVKQYPEQPAAPHQQYPEQPTAQHQQYTEQPGSQHQQYPEQPSTQHQQYPEQPSAQHQQFPEQPSALHQQFPEQPALQHQQFPKQPSVQHQQFPEQPAAQQFPEQSGAQHQQIPKQQTAQHQQFPEQPTTQHQQFPEQTTAQHQPFPEQPTAQHQPFPEQPATQHQSFPEQPAAQHQSFPEQPAAQHQPFPEQPAAQHQPFPEQPAAQHQPFSEQPAAQHQPFPEQPAAAQHQQFPELPAAQHQQFPELSTAQHQQFPDQPTTQQQYTEQPPSQQPQFSEQASSQHQQYSEQAPTEHQFSQQSSVQPKFSQSPPQSHFIQTSHSSHQNSTQFPQQTCLEPQQFSQHSPKQQFHQQSSPQQQYPQQSPPMQSFPQCSTSQPQQFTQQSPPSHQSPTQQQFSQSSPTQQTYPQSQLSPHQPYSQQQPHHQSTQEPSPQTQYSQTHQQYSQPPLPQQYPQQSSPQQQYSHQSSKQGYTQYVQQGQQYPQQPSPKLPFASQTLQSPFSTGTQQQPYNPQSIQQYSGHQNQSPFPPKSGHTHFSPLSPQPSNPGQQFCSSPSQPGSQQQFNQQSQLSSQSQYSSSQQASHSIQTQQYPQQIPPSNPSQLYIKQSTQTISSQQYTSQSNKVQQYSQQSQQTVSSQPFIQPAIHSPSSHHYAQQPKQSNQVQTKKYQHSFGQQQKLPSSQSTFQQQQFQTQMHSAVKLPSQIQPAVQQTNSKTSTTKGGRIKQARQKSASQSLPTQQFSQQPVEKLEPQQYQHQLYQNNSSQQMLSQQNLQQTVKQSQKLADQNYQSINTALLKQENLTVRNIKQETNAVYLSKCLKPVLQPVKSQLNGHQNNQQTFQQRNQSQLKSHDAHQMENEQHNGGNAQESALIPFRDKMDSSISYEWAIPLMKEYVLGVLENSHKMMILFVIINQTLEIGDKLLVFSQSLSTLDLLEHFLGKIQVPKRSDLSEDLNAETWCRNKNYFRLDGSTSAQEREKLINEFNRNENISLFLLSTRAGCLGINLVGANRIVVMDASWNPCHDAQAVCRIYRYGQKKQCHIYRLVTDNSLEKRIYDRQVNKQGMSDRVVDELNPESNFTWKDVTTLIQDDEDDNPIQELSKFSSSYSDDVLKHLVTQMSQSLSKEPFEHESLLLDRKDLKLTKQEKRLAKQSYEMAKRANMINIRTTYTYMPGGGGQFIINNKPCQWVGGTTVRVLPGQSAVQGAGGTIRPGTTATPITASPSLMSTLFKQGVMVQKLTIPSNVSIPVLTPGAPPVVIPAGQDVLVLRTPKGVYLRLPDGRIIAVQLPPSLLAKTQFRPNVVSHFRPAVSKGGNQSAVINTPRGQSIGIIKQTLQCGGTVRFLGPRSTTANASQNVAQSSAPEVIDLSDDDEPSAKKSNMALCASTVPLENESISGEPDQNQSNVTKPIANMLPGKQITIRRLSQGLQSSSIQVANSNDKCDLPKLLKQNQQITIMPINPTTQQNRQKLAPQLAQPVRVQQMLLQPQQGKRKPLQKNMTKIQLAPFPTDKKLPRQQLTITQPYQSRIQSQKIRQTVLLQQNSQKKIDSFIGFSKSQQVHPVSSSKHSPSQSPPVLSVENLQQLLPSSQLETTHLPSPLSQTKNSPGSVPQVSKSVQQIPKFSLSPLPQALKSTPSPLQQLSKSITCHTVQTSKPLPGTVSPNSQSSSNSQSLSISVSQNSQPISSTQPQIVQNDAGLLSQNSEPLPSLVSRSPLALATSQSSQLPQKSHSVSSSVTQNSQTNSKPAAKNSQPPSSTQPHNLSQQLKHTEASDLPQIPNDSQNSTDLRSQCSSSPGVPNLQSAQSHLQQQLQNCESQCILKPEARQTSPTVQTSEMQEHQQIHLQSVQQSKTLLQNSRSGQQHSDSSYMQQQAVHPQPNAGLPPPSSLPAVQAEQQINTKRKKVTNRHSSKRTTPQQQSQLATQGNVQQPQAAEGSHQFPHSPLSDHHMSEPHYQPFTHPLQNSDFQPFHSYTTHKPILRIQHPQPLHPLQHGQEHSLSSHLSHVSHLYPMPSHMAGNPAPLSDLQPQAPRAWPVPQSSMASFHPFGQSSPYYSSCHSHENNHFPFQPSFPIPQSPATSINNQSDSNVDLTRLDQSSSACPAEL